MNIVFNTHKVEKLLTSERELMQRYGDKQAVRIRQRLFQLQVAANLADISALSPTWCEELKGDRQGQLSVRLLGLHRLIFEPATSPVPKKPDGGLDWTRVTDINIIEVVDYHG